MLPSVAAMMTTTMVAAMRMRGISMNCESHLHIRCCRQCHAINHQKNFNKNKTSQRPPPRNLLFLIPSFPHFCVFAPLSLTPSVPSTLCHSFHSFFLFSRVFMCCVKRHQSKRMGETATTTIATSSNNKKWLMIYVTLAF